MWDKARKILYRGGEILELLMAAARRGGDSGGDDHACAGTGTLLGTPDDDWCIYGVSGCRF